MLWHLCMPWFLGWFFVALQMLQNGDSRHWSRTDHSQELGYSEYERIATKKSGNPQVLKQDLAGIINPVSLFYPPVTNMAIEFSHLRMILHLDARLQRISHCHVRLPMPGPGFCPSFEARGAEKGTGWLGCFGGEMHLLYRWKSNRRRNPDFLPLKQRFPCLNIVHFSLQSH